MSAQIKNHGLRQRVLEPRKLKRSEARAPGNGYGFN
jgi:hypothetical protein